MIGFFADPYPDELLYSVCSRYHRRMRNISKEATARDLFGKAQTKISVDFQTRLDYLVGQLPAATYSASRLINKHTMLPLYAPFMPAERRAAAWRDMRGDSGSSLYGRLGVLSYKIKIERLRFCPACVEEDRSRYGEPYWHRVHQCPGVEVCPTHAVFLLDSEVKIRNRSSRETFVTARQSIDEMPPTVRVTHPLDLKDREHRTLMRLARDAAWVLNAQIEASALNVLRRRYLRLLLERGFATYGGTVSHAHLKARFLDYYSPSLLERLGYELEGRYHWLRHLVNDWARAHHPLRHLLLIQFLGCSAEEFFRLPVEIEPFGKGPWPCLNPAGGHYRETRIGECLISHTKDESKRLRGTFLCECGFSYRRVGPDTMDEQQYQYDRILRYGEAWYEKLRGMRTAGNHSRAEMAQALGISVTMLETEIKRLNWSSASALPPLQRYKWHRAARTSNNLNIRNKHRERWHHRAAKNPNASRTELRWAVPEAYNWLAKHDKKWLEENSPKRRRSRRTDQPVDWAERDKNYAAAVREVAAKMLTAPDRPVRVSRTGLAKKLGILAVVTKTAAKLPLTNKTLDEISESIAAFAIRRIYWTADCYRQEQIKSNRWKLQTRAAVSNQMARDPEVKAAFEERVRALREMSESGWEGSEKG